MKSIICEKSEAVMKAAEQIKDLLKAKPDAVLALAGGRSTRDLYLKLAEMCENKEISFRDARIFLVADFDEAPEGMSYREKLERDLISRIDLKEENWFCITKDNFKDYDDMIKEQGGIDLIVLGLGANAHIGFNEPAVPFNSLSHRQRITDATKRQNSAEFGGEDKVPGIGYTMGIMTIYQAEKFMVMAFGDEKAEPVFKMYYGRNDSRFPAAFLQVPTEVNCYMDKAAAAKL